MRGTLAARARAGLAVERGQIELREPRGSRRMTGDWIAESI
jgi:hypothetical protein